MNLRLQFTLEDNLREELEFLQSTKIKLKGLYRE